MDTFAQLNTKTVCYHHSKVSINYKHQKCMKYYKTVEFCKAKKMGDFYRTWLSKKMLVSK